MNQFQLTQTTRHNEIEKPLLDQVIAATKQTKPEQTKVLLKAFTDSALKGTITWDKNLTGTINQAIDRIDALLSKQLSELLHHEKFKKLEGTWRGIEYLLKQSQVGQDIKVKLFNANKAELSRDFAKSMDFDQSHLFKQVYEQEFGTPGGEPYGLLVGDYSFSHHPEDINLLSEISHVSAAGFCPFISAADSKMFGFDTWTELSVPNDLNKIFASQEYTKWRQFRETEDARFVSLILPRALARLPYGENTKPIEAFKFEETNQKQLHHDNYCWMNAAYALATKINNAYSQYGWTTAIRGAEGGGKVQALPMHTFETDNGDIDSQCPTEIGITDRREAELSALGFMPLCHYKNTDYAVFFGAQSVQKPKIYDAPDASANALISSRLPYIMATSRFAHYLKVMARDKIGSFMESTDVENWLNRWILQYVNANADSKHNMKAKYPLAEAKISVEEVPGRPGSYHAVAWLKPWLQMEELTTSLRIVAKIPQIGNK